MKNSLACTKARGSDLAGSECFPTTHHILSRVMSHCSVFAAADTAWISKTAIKDGMGQRTVCIFHMTVGILQTGAKSNQLDVYSMSSLGSLPCKPG